MIFCTIMYCFCLGGSGNVAKYIHSLKHLYANLIISFPVLGHWKPLTSTDERFDSQKQKKSEKLVPFVQLTTHWHRACRISFVTMFISKYLHLLVGTWSMENSISAEFGSIASEENKSQIQTHWRPKEVSFLRFALINKEVFILLWASQVAQWMRNLPVVQEMQGVWVWSLHKEDPWRRAQ